MSFCAWGRRDVLANTETILLTIMALWNKFLVQILLGVHQIARGTRVRCGPRARPLRSGVAEYAIKFVPRWVLRSA